MSVVQIDLHHPDTDFAALHQFVRRGFIQHEHFDHFLIHFFLNEIGNIFFVVDLVFKTFLQQRQKGHALLGKVIGIGVAQIFADGISAKQFPVFRLADGA